MASKFMKSFGQIASIAGPILGGLFGGPVGAAVGGAAGGAINGKGGLGKAALGAGTGYLGAKIGGVQGQGMNVFSNPLQSVKNAFGGIGGMFGKSSSPVNPASAMSSVSPYVGSGFNQMNQGAGSFISPLMSNSMAQSSSNGGSLSKGVNGITKNPLLLGLGTMAGSQFIRSPKVPELPQSVMDFQNTAKNGNPLQNQASSALQQQLGQTQQNLGQPEIDALNRQYDLAQEQELKQIDSMYKSLRPGTDPLTDSSYQKDLGRVRDRYATLRADSTAQAQRQISNDFASQRGQQIAQAAGIGQQQMSQLAQLSQYDLDRQLSQLNIDYTDKQTLRDYLLRFGGNLAAQNLDPNKAMNDQIQAMLYQKLLGGKP